MRVSSWSVHCYSVLLLLLSSFEASVVGCSASPSDNNSNLQRNNNIIIPDQQIADRSVSAAVSGGNPEACLDQQQQQQHQQQPIETQLPHRCGEMEAVEANAEENVASVSGAAPGKTCVPVEDTIPERYIIGCNGDRVEAARRWKETCDWRKDKEVDGILERPQPRFHECREVFPVFLHGRSRQGMPVLWERIGKVNLARADELDLPLSVLTPNYVFLNECVWKVLLDKGEDDNDDAQFITVEDVAGVRPWHLTPRILSVLRALTGIMKAHYVERCHKSYIINAPRAFTILWRVVSAMLDPRTRAKISILGTDYLTAMEEEIDMSQIPPEYGGQSGRAMDDSDDERKIIALVTRLNAKEKEGAEASEGGAASS